MAVLSVQGIGKTYGTDVILEDINFVVNEGDRIGLIGRNGAGKTTLFRILSGALHEDGGQLTLGKDLKIGCLDQMPNYGDLTVFSYCLEAFSDVLALMARQNALESEISDYGHRHLEPPATLMEEYGRILEILEHSNGYAYESEIRGTLKGLGFDDSQFPLEAERLSGGQKSRLNLARLLLTRPDIFLLDEPTNHLDMSSVNWLESYIKKSGKTFILISHDRYFLDQICGRIMEIENRKLLECKGTYSDFIRFKDALYETLTREYENAISEYERQEDIVRKMKQHGTEKLVKRAQSREKILDKMELPDKPFRLNEAAKLTLKIKRKTGQDVLRIENAVKRFDELTVMDGLSFDVFAGDRIGLIGPNGTGKTTLLKAICHQLLLDDGRIVYGTNVEPGYYDQDLKAIKASNNLIEEVSDMDPKLDTTVIRTLLGAFLFKGDDVFKLMSDLSGGERARMSLIQLMLSGANVLMMDEPTNHLDISSREVLENALLNFEGTLLAVSHDRYFLNRICNRILVLDNGMITEYMGNYDYYLEKSLEASELDEEDAILDSRTKTQIKDDKRKEREKMQEARKIRQTLAELEKSIAVSEGEISKLEELLCSEDVYTDFEKARRIHSEIELIKSQLAELYERWESLL